MSLYPNPTNGIHAVLSRIKFFFEIKNWRISRDRFYKLNPDIFVDLKMLIPLSWLLLICNDLF